MHVQFFNFHVTGSTLDMVGLILGNECMCGCDAAAQGSACMLCWLRLLESVLFCDFDLALFLRLCAEAGGTVLKVRARARVCVCVCV